MWQMEKFQYKANRREQKRHEYQIPNKSHWKWTMNIRLIALPQCKYQLNIRYYATKYTWINGKWAEMHTHTHAAQQRPKQQLYMSDIMACNYDMGSLLIIIGSLMPMPNVNFKRKIYAAFQVFEWKMITIIWTHDCTFIPLTPIHWWLGPKSGTSEKSKEIAVNLNDFVETKIRHNNAHKTNELMFYGCELNVLLISGI